jgi:hypothetical protein
MTRNHAADEVDVGVSGAGDGHIAMHAFGNHLAITRGR